KSFPANGISRTLWICISNCWAGNPTPAGRKPVPQQGQVLFAEVALPDGRASDTQTRAGLLTPGPTSSVNVCETSHPQARASFCGPVCDRVAAACLARGPGADRQE